MCGGSERWREPRFERWQALRSLFGVDRGRTRSTQDACHNTIPALFLRLLSGGKVLQGWNQGSAEPKVLKAQGREAETFPGPFTTLAVARKMFDGSVFIHHFLTVQCLRHKAQYRCPMPLKEGWPIAFSVRASLRVLS